MNMYVLLFYSHVENCFIDEYMYINIDEIDMQVDVQISHIELYEYALSFMSWLLVNLNMRMKDHSIIVCMVKFKVQIVSV